MPDRSMPLIGKAAVFGVSVRKQRDDLPRQAQRMTSS